MLETLQRQIRQRLASKYVSANALEKKAGLKTSAVQNILQGKSKRPGADTLYAIAQELECTVSDLLEEVPAQINVESVNDKNFNKALDYELYINALEHIKELFKEHELKLNKAQTLQIADEIYNYSIRGKLKYVDMRFTEWLVDRYSSPPIKKKQNEIR